MHPTATPPAVTPARDPRETITLESFAIDPALLGLPLARPLQRAAAMLLDLLIIALLVNAGGVLFGVAAAWVFFRVSGKSTGGGLLRRSWRFAFRSLAAVVLFAVVASQWGSLRSFAPGGGEGRVAERTESSAAIDLGGRQGLMLAGEIAALLGARSEAEGAEVASRIASRLRATGMESAEIRAMIAAVAQGGNQPWAERVARQVSRESSEEPASAPPLDSLLGSFTAALTAGDSATLAVLRPRVVQSLAADTLAVLQSRVRAADQERDRLHAQLEQARTERGILSFLWKAADDLGLTFGWSGLYFTAFLALWQGQTPGKRLLRIRVVRLDGKPMTWWASFERFGGYAASLFTGLLGFAQIAWDRNRQGMHDKITETVVVRL